MNDSKKQATKGETYTIFAIIIAIIAFTTWYLYNGIMKGDKYIFLKAFSAESVLVVGTLVLGTHLVRKRIKKQNYDQNNNSNQ